MWSYFLFMNFEYMLTGSQLIYLYNYEFQFFSVKFVFPWLLRQNKQLYQTESRNNNFDDFFFMICRLEIDSLDPSKGQLISEWKFGCLQISQNPNQNCNRFLPMTFNKIKMENSVISVQYFWKRPEYTFKKIHCNLNKIWPGPIVYAHVSSKKSHKARLAHY